MINGRTIEFIKIGRTAGNAGEVCTYEVSYSIEYTKRKFTIIHNYDDGLERLVAIAFEHISRELMQEKTKKENPPPCFTMFQDDEHEYCRSCYFKQNCKTQAIVEDDVESAIDAFLGKD